LNVLCSGVRVTRFWTHNS